MEEPVSHQCAAPRFPWNSHGSSRAEQGLDNWGQVVRQNGSQSQSSSELRGSQCEHWDGRGLRLCCLREAILAPLTKQWRSGQKSKLILSSKHKLSLSPLFLPSPLGYPFSSKAILIPAPKTQLWACQVRNFNRFFKVTEHQVLLLRELGAMSTWSPFSSFL